MTLTTRLVLLFPTIFSVACAPGFDEPVGAERAYHHSEYPEAVWIPAREGHYYDGRDGYEITHIIIHTMQGTYESAISWFRDPSNPRRTSTHYLIRSSDGAITQMVHEADAARHIGGWNWFTIGIEHEGWMEDPDRWYTDTMYRSSARLTRYLCDKYDIPIDREHILGHGDVPGALTNDPGPGWDWDYYMRLVRESGPEPPADAGAADASIADAATGADAAAGADAATGGDAGDPSSPDASVSVPDAGGAGDVRTEPDPSCGCAAPGGPNGSRSGLLAVTLALAIAMLRARRGRR